jgi:hypothetical protein
MWTYKKKYSSNVYLTYSHSSLKLHNGLFNRHILEKKPNMIFFWTLCHKTQKLSRLKNFECASKSIQIIFFQKSKFSFNQLLENENYHNQRIFNEHKILTQFIFLKLKFKLDMYQKLIKTRLKNILKITFKQTLIFKTFRFRL